MYQFKIEKDGDLFTEPKQDLLDLLNKNLDIKILADEYLIKLQEMKHFPTNGREEFNNELAIRQICNFLNHLNQLIKEYGTELNIDKNVFIKYFSSKTYHYFKTVLIDLGIISPVYNKKTYGNGQRILYDSRYGICKCYQVCNTYLKQKDYTILFFNKKEKVMKNIDINCKVDIKMVNTIINEELDYVKVFTEEIKYYNNTKEQSEFALILRLSRALSLNKERWMKPGKLVSRIYHSFSGLSRVTRKCFKTLFYCLDLKNSQPILLIHYLKSVGIEIDISYKEIVESGLFYEQFYFLKSEKIDLNDKEKEKVRKDVKENLYKEIFFAFNIKGKYNKHFKQLYPKVWEALNTIHSDKNKSLASILQNIEAEIFNNLQVKKSTKYFTLFDAIYFNNIKDKESLEKQILQAGEILDIKFKVVFEINQ